VQVKVDTIRDCGSVGPEEVAMGDARVNLWRACPIGIGICIRIRIPTLAPDATFPSSPHIFVHSLTDLSHRWRWVAYEYCIQPTS
jgi:hypothetical protein